MSVIDLEKVAKQRRDEKLATLIASLHDEIVMGRLNEDGEPARTDNGELVLTTDFPAQAAAVVVFHLWKFLADVGRHGDGNEPLRKVLGALHDLCGDLSCLETSHIQHRLSRKVAKSALDAVMNVERHTELMIELMDGKGGAA
jgi:hypothetical protein